MCACVHASEFGELDFCTPFLLQMCLSFTYTLVHLFSSLVYDPFLLLLFLPLWTFIVCESACVSGLL